MHTTPIQITEEKKILLKISEADLQNHKIKEDNADIRKSKKKIIVLHILFPGEII